MSPAPTTTEQAQLDALAATVTADINAAVSNALLDGNKAATDYLHLAAQFDNGNLIGIEGAVARLKDVAADAARQGVLAFWSNMLLVLGASDPARIRLLLAQIQAAG